MPLRHSFTPPDNTRLAHLCGPLDEHLRSIEAAFDVKVARRGEDFRIDGPKAQAQQVLTLLEALYAKAGRTISAETVQLAIAQAQGGQGSAGTARRSGARKAAATPDDSAEGPTLHTRRADLQGRTPNQVQYLRNIMAHDLSFGIGPAGTGKTFLAVACAVDALERSAVQRIILTRPAVEAGEKLGFLPGDLAEKVNPYLRPLHDALLDMLGPQKMASLQETGIIEVAPLAFMRGRTLNDAFIILDEAQNTTREQMKMFLTRLGFGSRAAITGDITQIDLPAQGEDSASRSGLVHALHVLKGVKGVAFRHFTSADVVRHPLVGRIVQAYDDYEKLPSSHQ